MERRSARGAVFVCWDGGRTRRQRTLARWRATCGCLLPTWTPRPQLHPSPVSSRWPSTDMLSQTQTSPLPTTVRYSLRRSALHSRTPGNQVRTKPLEMRGERVHTNGEEASSAQGRVACFSLTGVGMPSRTESGSAAKAQLRRLPLAGHRRIVQARATRRPLPVRLRNPPPQRRLRSPRAPPLP